MKHETVNTIVAVLALTVGGASLAWQVVESKAAKREVLRVIDVGLNAEADTNTVMLRWGVDIINVGERPVYVQSIQPQGLDTQAQFAAIGVAFPLDSAMRLPLIPGEARRFVSKRFATTGPFLRTPQVAALLITTTRDQHRVRVEPAQIGLHVDGAEYGGVVTAGYNAAGQAVLAVDPANYQAIIGAKPDM